MKKVILILTLFSLFFSCSPKKPKTAQIMFLDGSVTEAANPLDIDFQKGDTIVMRVHCGNFNPCEQVIYGFYKGTLLETDVKLENGQFKESFSYKKMVFLKNITD